MKEQRFEIRPISTQDHGSHGSMNDPMYRNIHVNGHYSSVSGRMKNRFCQRNRGVCISQKKNFWEL